MVRPRLPRHRLLLLALLAWRWRKLVAEPPALRRLLAEDAADVVAGAELLPEQLQQRPQRLHRRPGVVEAAAPLPRLQPRDCWAGSSWWRTKGGCVSSQVAKLKVRRDKTPVNFCQREKHGREPVLVMESRSWKTFVLSGNRTGMYCGSG